MPALLAYVVGMMSEGRSIANKPDYLVCTCMGVMYSEIVQAISEGAESFDALSDLLQVGTGCSSCVDEIMEILREQVGK